MRFIHYGASEFERDKFETIKNIPYFCKPSGGLWASPVDSEWGWHDWASSEGFNTDRLNEYFEFEIAGDVAVIDSWQDARKLLLWSFEDVGCHGACLKSIDFECNCYDAILLTVQGERETRFHDRYSLYGWDCESVLVLNPEVIVPL